MTLLTCSAILFLGVTSGMYPEGLSDLQFSANNNASLTPVDYFNADEYMITPGDQIWISFPGGIPFSSSNDAVSSVFIPVGLDGILNIPTLPPVDTNGMTLHTLQNTITGLVSRSYRGMTVSVGLARSASFQIPVTGQVGRPGIVTVNGLFRLTETLELAGGLSSSGSSSNIILISLDGDSTNYNLNDFFSHGDIRSNPLMQLNTRIHVQTLVSTILVEGAIYPFCTGVENGTSPANRKMIEFIPGENARDAVIRVGGTSGVADLNNCYVHRINADSIPEYLPFAMQGHHTSVRLLPGDIVVVPSATFTVNVTGEVVASAPIPYSPGMNVNYYIGLAGGFNSVARRNSIRTILSNGERINAELTDIVPPGATIEVPRVSVKFWEEYLVILTGVATVVIAYQSIFSN
ncbi:MAG: SLBB domain-containing protein [Candidatus Sabulitectum sp.]|nr:SLBB domain-containing protein [Candidatus Sabulitectum sp.]